MHSLFLRIFLLFLLAMVLIVGSSIATTFTITSRESETLDYQRRPSAAIQASEVLERGGVGALQSWLAANKTVVGDRELFVIGPNGQDILGRSLPENIVRPPHRTPDPLPLNRPPPQPPPHVSSATQPSST